MLFKNNLSKHLCSGITHGGERELAYSSLVFPLTEILEESGGVESVARLITFGSSPLGLQSFAGLFFER